MRALLWSAALPLVLGPLSFIFAQDAGKPVKLPLHAAAARVAEDIKADIVLVPGLEGEVKLPDRSLEPLEQVRFIADQVGAAVWPFGRGSFLVVASRPVKVMFEDAPISRVLDEVSRVAGLNLLSSGFAEKTITIEGRGDPVLTFLDRLSAATGVSFIRERGLILRVSTEEHEKRLAAKPLSDETLAALGLGRSAGQEGAVVSLDFVETPVSEIAAYLGKEAGITIEVDKNVGTGTVSLRMKDAPWEDALEAVAILCEATVWDDGKGNVSLRRPPRITMEFSEAEVKVVLDLMARNTGINLEISEEIGGPVSLNWRNLAWRDALYVLSRCHPFHLELSEEGKLVAKGM